MLTSRTQENRVVQTNSTITEQALTDLSNFLNSCQMIGIKPDDFEMIICTTVDFIIDGADNDSPTREFKKSLLFLRILRVFLNSLRIN